MWDWVVRGSMGRKVFVGARRRTNTTNKMGRAERRREEVKSCSGEELQEK